MAGLDLICLHGLGRSAADWNTVRDGLEHFGRVRAPDLPRAGSARSLSTALVVQPGSVIIGHSLGAVLALQMASGPPSVRGLIMTGGFYPPHRNNRTYAAAIRDYARHRIAVAETLASEGAMPRPGGARALASLARLGLRPEKFHRLGASVRIPVLVIHGDQDHHVPIDFMYAAAGRHPTWDVAVVAGGGHQVHVDQPADWLAITSRWLEGLNTA